VTDAARIAAIPARHRSDPGRGALRPTASGHWDWPGAGLREGDSRCRRLDSQPGGAMIPAHEGRCCQHPASVRRDRLAGSVARNSTARPRGSIGGWPAIDCADQTVFTTNKL
jgi:hypothetical protein